MIDILFLAWNRLEFTRKTFETMLANTDWSLVARIVVYDDGSQDGTREYLLHALEQMPNRPETHFRTTNRLGPVGIMRHFLSNHVNGEPSPIFAKIDSDTMLPPGWLGECLDVMAAHPEVGLLGIEAFHPIGAAPRDVVPADFIGGIGLMRRKAFGWDLPQPREAGSRFGFTAWQERHEEVKKAWLNPALPVCLLNLMPHDTWRKLSEKYIANGWQRPWPDMYTEQRSDLWKWWAD